VIASLILLRVSPSVKPETGRRARVKDIVAPFRDSNFRVLMNAYFISGIAFTMVNAFINPYLMEARRLPMSAISVISAAMSVLSFALLPIWGRLTDRVGARNCYRIGFFGMAFGILCLAGEGWLLLGVYALLAWNMGGLFGCGMTLGSSCLIMSLGEERKNNIYVAAATFAGCAGGLIGALGGGVLLEGMKKLIAGNIGPHVPLLHYQIYYALCAFGCYLSGVAATRLQDGRRHLSTSQMAVATYRAVRNRMLRLR
jgi:MFS family permease